jgi:hypothetical protein
MTEPLATVILWGVIAASIILTGLAAIDSLREYRDVRFGYRRAKVLFVNGRIRIALYRKKAGLWYVVGFNAFFFLTLLATYRTVFLQEPPSGSDAVVVSVLRILYLIVVFSFWTTMRGQRRVRKELAEAADIKQDVREVREIQEKTYERVEIIDEKLDTEKTTLDAKESELRQKSGELPSGAGEATEEGHV